MLTVGYEPGMTNILPLNFFIEVLKLQYVSCCTIPNANKDTSMSKYNAMKSNRVQKGKHSHIPNHGTI